MRPNREPHAPGSILGASTFFPLDFLADLLAPRFHVPHVCRETAQTADLIVSGLGDSSGAPHACLNRGELEVHRPPRAMPGTRACVT
jgi:hypothetical protein